MIHVEQGGRYTGETYIWCGVCQANPLDTGPGLFTGAGMMALSEFFIDHLHLDPAAVERVERAEAQRAAAAQAAVVLRPALAQQLADQAGTQLPDHTP